MDPLTEFAYNLNNGLLTTISLVLNNDLFFAALILLTVLATEKRNPKRVKIFSAILLAVIIAVILKSLFAIQRPCSPADFDFCPPDYAFPSLHATAAFTLMITFLNKKNYWLFMLFALFVSFTRMVLGVHTFLDIAAALPVAIVTYYIIDVLWRRYIDEKR